MIGNKQLSGKRLAKLLGTSKLIMIYDSKPWVGKAMVGYADGTVNIGEPMNWLEEELKSRLRSASLSFTADERERPR